VLQPESSAVLSRLPYEPDLDNASVGINVNNVKNPYVFGIRVFYLKPFDKLKVPS